MTGLYVSSYLNLILFREGNRPGLTQYLLDDLREMARKIMLKFSEEVPNRTAQILVPQLVIHTWGS